MLKLPGLIDPHVHMRDPGATHKEDWDTGTAAALAGGVTMLLAMPNTKPPIFDAATLDMALSAAKAKANCDYAQYLGAGPANADWDAHPGLPARAAGLKMYLDQTFGELRLDDMSLWMQHFQRWPKDRPIVAHSESRSMAAVILMAAIYDRPVHIAHVSLKEEILLIKAAKQRGIQVTCEVTPHHLFLTAPSQPSPAVAGEGKGGGASSPLHLPSPPSPSRSTPAGLPKLGEGCRGGEGSPSPAFRERGSGGEGRWEVRPRLATQADVDALWQNLDAVDCFATDHAPHTLAEKDGENPPPGFPGLETFLPLLLTAVDDGRLTLDQLIEKTVTNPRRIFALPEQPETWVEVDEKAKYTIHAAEMKSRCGWTPFEGWPVRGRVRRVVLRGREAFKDGQVLVENGFGKNVRG